MAGQGAGALLAIALYPMFVALLNGGPALMWTWVGAKFANHSTVGAATGAPPTGGQSHPLRGGGALTRTPQ